MNRYPGSEEHKTAYPSGVTSEGDAGFVKLKNGNKQTQLLTFLKICCINLLPLLGQVFDSTTKLFGGSL